MVWCPMPEGGFWISKGEVSQTAWLVVMGIVPVNNPYWEYSSQSVTHASLEERREFVRKFGELNSVRAELPTEEQLACASRVCGFTVGDGFRFIVPVFEDRQAELEMRRRLRELHEARKRRTAEILSAFVRDKMPTREIAGS